MFAAAFMLVDAAPAAAEFNATGELLRVILSLGGIIALIFAAGWFSRRLQRARGGVRGRRIRCVESFALGTRERIVLLEADGQRLLIGTGPGGMRTLHVYAAADAAEPAPAAADAATPAFGELLARWRHRA